MVVVILPNPFFCATADLAKLGIEEFTASGIAAAPLFVEQLIGST
jgi:hypothetical protein